MILTFDSTGVLAVETPTGNIKLEVASLEDIHKAIETYQIDFIAPAVKQPHIHTGDKKLLDILKEFHLQRAQVLMAAAILKQLPQA